MSNNNNTNKRHINTSFIDDTKNDNSNISIKSSISNIKRIKQTKNISNTNFYNNLNNNNSYTADDNINVDIILNERQNKIQNLDISLIDTKNEEQLADYIQNKINKYHKKHEYFDNIITNSINNNTYEQLSDDTIAMRNKYNGKLKEYNAMLYEIGLKREKRELHNKQVLQQDTISLQQQIKYVQLNEYKNSLSPLYQFIKFWDKNHPEARDIDVWINKIKDKKYVAYVKHYYKNIHLWIAGGVDKSLGHYKKMPDWVYTNMLKIFPRSPSLKFVQVYRGLNFKNEQEMLLYQPNWTNIKYNDIVIYKDPEQDKATSWTTSFNEAYSYATGNGINIILETWVSSNNIILDMNYLKENTQILESSVGVSVDQRNSETIIIAGEYYCRLIKFNYERIQLDYLTISNNNNTNYNNTNNTLSLIQHQANQKGKDIHNQKNDIYNQGYNLLVQLYQSTALIKTKHEIKKIIELYNTLSIKEITLFVKDANQTNHEHLYNWVLYFSNQ